MIGRLTNQKGLGLVRYAMNRLMERGVQVAILGTGDAFDGSTVVNGAMTVYADYIKKPVPSAATEVPAAAPAS